MQPAGNGIVSKYRTGNYTQSEPNLVQTTLYNLAAAFKNQSRCCIVGKENIVILHLLWCIQWSNTTCK
jgi:hypothetical protein